MRFSVDIKKLLLLAIFILIFINRYNYIVNKDTRFGVTVGYSDKYKSNYIEVHNDFYSTGGDKIYLNRLKSIEYEKGNLKSEKGRVIIRVYNDLDKWDLRYNTWYNKVIVIGAEYEKEFKRIIKENTN